MIRKALYRRTHDMRWPRTSGDDPGLPGRITSAIGLAPHERG